MGVRDKSTTPWSELWNTAVIGLKPGEDMESAGTARNIPRGHKSEMYEETSSVSYFGGGSLVIGWYLCC